MSMFLWNCGILPDNGSMTTTADPFHHDPKEEDCDTRDIFEKVAPTTWYASSVAAAADKIAALDSGDSQVYDTELTDSRDSIEYRVTKQVYDPISEFRDEIIDDCSVKSSGQDSTLEEDMGIGGRRSKLRSQRPLSILSTTDVIEEELELEFGRTSPVKQNFPPNEQRKLSRVYPSYPSSPFFNANGEMDKDVKMFIDHCDAAAAASTTSVDIQSPVRRSKRATNISCFTSTAIPTPLHQQQQNHFIASNTSTPVNIRSGAEVRKARAKVMSIAAATQKVPDMDQNQNGNESINGIVWNLLIRPSWWK